MYTETINNIHAGKIIAIQSGREICVDCIHPNQVIDIIEISNLSEDEAQYPFLNALSSNEFMQKIGLTARYMTTEEIQKSLGEDIELFISMFSKLECLFLAEPEEITELQQFINTRLVIQI